jgi:hypothetical protein
MPQCNENGLLPPGRHPASLQEAAERFGRTMELRRARTESNQRLHDDARRAGEEKFVINGSFVTDVDEPKDVDCVLLIGASFPSDVDAEAEFLAGFPFLEIQLVQDHLFRVLVESFFATDPYSRSKGMIEVIL